MNEDFKMRKGEVIQTAMEQGQFPFGEVFGFTGDRDSLDGCGPSFTWQKSINHFEKFGTFGDWKFHCLFG